MNQYEEMIKNQPAGCDRAILRVLEFHRGKEGAIGGEELTRLVNLNGFHIDQRTVRESIKELRRTGHLICSTAGNGGGYYLATTAEEFEQFIDQEFKAKIKDMSETLNAMQQAARDQFGPAVQGRLF